METLDVPLSEHLDFARTLDTHPEIGHSGDVSTNLAPETSEVVTTAEAARRLGVTTMTIRRWVSAGLLPAKRVGPKGVYRIAADDLSKVVRDA